MPLEVTTCIWYQMKGENLKLSFLDISMSTTCTLMHKSVTMATIPYKFEPKQKLTFFITERYMQLFLTFVNRQTVSDINSHHLTSTIFLQHLTRCHGNHTIYDYYGYYVIHEHYVYHNSFDSRYIKAIFHHCHHRLI